MPVVTGMVLGLLAALLGAIMSLLNFSRTGPQVPDEVWQRYRQYSVWAFLRLVFWSAAIATWMAWLGIFSYILTVSIQGGIPTQFGCITSAIISMLAISFLQFVGQLLHVPSSIIMSSNYKSSRLYPLWRKLTVSRVRWMKLVLALVLVGPIFGYLISDSNNFDRDTVLIFTFLLYSPWLFVAWPEVLWFSKPRAQGGKSSHPNIIMIGCDTLRVDRLGAAGYHRDNTPFIDALTKRGRLFTNCYTPQARTAPSLLSLLSGTWPGTHGVRSNFSSAMRQELKGKTLADQLSAQGYQTVALADWAGSDLGKYPLGFDVCEAPSDQWNIKYLIRQGPKDIRLFLSLFSHNRFGRIFLPEIFYLAGTPLNDYLGKRTRHWLNRFARQDKPFFLNLFMGTSHPPFGSEYPYYDLYADKAYEGESKFLMSRLVDPFDVIRSQKEPREAFDLEQIIDLYDGCVRRFDDEVRHIIQHLHKCKFDDNTIIVIYSDHGMELFEHDTWGQGNSAVGEASPRIPLFILDPRDNFSGVDNRVIRSIDLMPTLLELCGLSTPESVEGVSLRPFFEDDNYQSDLVAFFETGEWLATPPGQHPDHLSYPEVTEILEVPDDGQGNIVIKQEFVTTVNSARDRMIRRGKWKLVYIPLNTGEQYLLFNLDEDSACKNDLALEHPEVVATLKHELWELAQIGVDD